MKKKKSPGYFRILEAKFQLISCIIFSSAADIVSGAYQIGGPIGVRRPSVRQRQDGTTDQEEK